MSNARLVDSVVLDALGSMAAVDGPLPLDMQLADAEIDSLDLVELTQILEEEGQIDIAASAFADAISVGDVVDAVRSHLR